MEGCHHLAVGGHQLSGGGSGGGGGHQLSGGGH